MLIIARLLSLAVMPVLVYVLMSAVDPNWMSKTQFAPVMLAAAAGVSYLTVYTWVDKRLKTKRSKRFSFTVSAKLIVKVASFLLAGYLSNLAFGSSNPRWFLTSNGFMLAVLGAIGGGLIVMGFAYRLFGWTKGGRNRNGAGLSIRLPKMNKKLVVYSLAIIVAMNVADFIFHLSLGAGWLWRENGLTYGIVGTTIISLVLVWVVNSLFGWSKPRERSEGSDFSISEGTQRFFCYVLAAIFFPAIFIAIVTWHQADFLSRSGAGMFIMFVSMVTAPFGVWVMFRILNPEYSRHADGEHVEVEESVAEPAPARTPVRIVRKEKQERREKPQQPAKEPKIGKWEPLIQKGKILNNLPFEENYRSNARPPKRNETRRDRKRSRRPRGDGKAFGRKPFVLPNRSKLVN